jgi:hypothetical protein
MDGRSRVRDVGTDIVSGHAMPDASHCSLATRIRANPAIAKSRRSAASVNTRISSVVPRPP